MKNIKKLVATAGLLGIIIMSATSAQAGFFLSDRAAPSPTPCQTTPTIGDTILDVAIDLWTGVDVNLNSDCGGTTAGRGGFFLSD